ncbi:MAG: cyanophycin synthetase [Bacillota bacterium]
MQIVDITSFKGRNIYFHKPVIRMIIDVEDLFETSTKEINGFNEKLIEFFPGIKKHYCSRGYEGGFLERLKEGTYIAHVTEHLILELQSILGYDVYYGKTRLWQEPSIYSIVYEYENERCAIDCGYAGVRVISGLVGAENIEIEPILANLKKTSFVSQMGPSTKAIYEEAKRRNIPVRRLGEESLLQIGYGKYARLIQASLTDTTSCIAVDMAGNKFLTKQMLQDQGINVPDGDIAYTEESAVNIAKNLGYPVVVKPLNGNQGKGVTLNIGNEKELRLAYQEAFLYSNAVMVERFVKGNDYRVLVVGNKVSAVAERKPPYVIGDGVLSIQELVEAENKNHLRGEGHEKPLTKIRLDDISKQILSRQGLHIDYVPSYQEKINLRENGNLSTGGTSRDCTEEIHPINSMLAVKAAKTMGLEIAGIDIVAQDISTPLTSLNGAVIEVNACPGLRMHLVPSEGKAQNVASDIIDLLFPKGKPYSIPIVSVTGTNGKTTTTRIISHTLALAGKTVGMTCSSGTYVGNRCILKGDNTGAASAFMVLSNKEIDIAVLETARGGIVKKGLGYELADVAVVTNISEDHLGMDGMKTLEDLAFVKSLVVEAVKPGGYVVLNAQDKMTPYFLQRARDNIILFSLYNDNPLLLEHMKRGGEAVFVENQSITIWDKKQYQSVIGLKEIPITFEGKIECNIENSLAATGALYALNVQTSLIRAALMTFQPDTQTNPGRFNIFDLGICQVMLDYGHNPGGYQAVSQFIRSIDARRYVGIIGMPGDRMDRNIEEVGKICAQVFSHIYIKEDSSLRGRQPGEVANILYESVTENGCNKSDVEIVLSELDALKAAIQNARPGDFIVMFYERLEPALEVINQFRQQAKADLSSVFIYSDYNPQGANQHVAT